MGGTWVRATTTSVELWVPAGHANWVHAHVFGCGRPLRGGAV